MDQAIKINKEVNIVAFYFRNSTRRLRCFPKRMEYNGKRIEFSETGLVHPTKKGQRMIHVFDMTDGNSDYRLEFDAQELSWKLVAITEIDYGSLSQPLRAAAQY